LRVIIEQKTTLRVILKESFKNGIYYEKRHLVYKFFKIEIILKARENQKENLEIQKACIKKAGLLSIIYLNIFIKLFLGLIL
jgi:hypothetical protein